jgi:methylated-DNA-[protein]-cysteine S-methyltransferase
MSKGDKESAQIDVFETSWGWVAVAASFRGIRGTTLPVKTPERAMEQLGESLFGISGDLIPGAFPEFQRQVEDYLSGEREVMEVPLDLHGAPPFFRRAWQACCTIPRGETRSYAWLAAQAGSPKALRAAGQAMARNRVPLVVPCHRVIGADGEMHGFGGGDLGLKARLLRLEQGSG